jgi:hypothetical protein
MHFLLLLLKLVLDSLFPGWRDRVALAARADGRIEHVPGGPTMWDRWLSFMRQIASGQTRGKRKVRAEDSPVRRRT